MKTPPCPVCGAQHWPHCQRRAPGWVHDRYPHQVCPMTRAERAALERLVHDRLVDLARAAAADPPPF